MLGAKHRRKVVLLQIEPESNPASSGPVFFAAGFRPFFLLAGLWAVVAMALWLTVWFGGAGAWPAIPPALWHGHEMVFGFGGAAVGGFLLTAVPNWTGASIAGRPVALLTLAWAAGRLAMAAGAVLPPPVIAAVDLAFLPLLAVVVGRPLVAAGKARNMIFVVLLAILTAANLLVHLELMGRAATATAGLHLGIWLLLLMIAVVGGRIVPSFTKGGLRMAGITVEPKSWAALEIAAPASLVVVAAADLSGGGMPLGIAALLAAGLNGVRLAGWHGHRTAGVPLLWVLHAGYGWLVLGLLLTGLAALTPMVPPTTALHALTVGAIATMILGVMTRAALGHSGRPLAPARATVAAYALVVLAALARTGVPLVAGFDLAVAVSGALWMAAFGLFVMVYWPVCTGPRADGRPG